MAIITSSDLLFQNTSGVAQNTSSTITQGLSIVGGNGNNVYSVASIPATVQKIYINLYSTGYSSGPNSPVIQVRDNFGTVGVTQYLNILNSGSNYSSYSSSTATNMWVATPYYSMPDVSVEIWKIHDNQFFYRMYGNAGTTGVVSMLTGYGYISNISRISQIDISASGTYTFVNMYLNISWE
jgi:hypothetical protein